MDVMKPTGRPRFPGRTEFPIEGPDNFQTAVKRVLKELQEHAPQRYQEVLNYFPRAIYDPEHVRAGGDWAALSSGQFAMDGSERYEDFRHVFLHESGHNVLGRQWDDGRLQYIAPERLANLYSDTVVKELEESYTAQQAWDDSMKAEYERDLFVLESIGNITHERANELRRERGIPILDQPPFVIPPNARLQDIIRFRHPGESTPHTPPMTNELASTFLNQVYRDLLGRDPDGEGFQHYTNWLTTGRSREDVAQDIAGSPEFRNRFIRNLYQEILRREADPFGLGMYADQLRDNRPLNEILGSLVGSDEYFERCRSKA